MDRDRGTYTPPTEDNLSYTPRRPAARDQAPLTLIISGIVLVVVLIVAVLLFNSGIANHNKTIPEVGDTLSDLKDTKITEAQPLTDSDAGVDDSAAARFANDTEQPGLRSASVDTDLAPPPVAPIKGPLPSQADNASISSAATSSVAASSASASSAVSKSVAAATVPATAAAGTAAVQIGAFTSQDIANSEYAKVASSYGLFVGGAGKRIEKVETAGGTFYRTAFTGLSVDRAKSFCAALKAAGHDCLVR